MPTMHSEQWGTFGKLAYKWCVRSLLVKLVKETDNTMDDNLIKYLDVLAGYKA